MFLSSSYFQGELYLPNIKVSDSVGHSSYSRQTVGENDLNWYIEKYEREFLIKLLGSTLYHNFINGINETSPLQIWIDLKNAIYVESNDYYFSPAANYVFFYVSRRGRTQTGVQGEMRGTNSYAEIANDSDKLVKVWNDMCEMVEDFRCSFLAKNWNEYKQYADRVICYRDFIKINKFGI